MAALQELITLTRFPPGFKFALMILYFPIGVFLIVCRLLIALHTYMIVCLMPRTAARRQFVRGMLGVLGIHIWVEEDADPVPDGPRILITNYTSVLDHIVSDVVYSHFVPYHCDVPKPFQWVMGYKDLGSAQGKSQFIQNCKVFMQENKWPLLLQPEGAPTNNNVGLLKFNSLAFEFELPVQPVSISLSRLSFPCALTTIESPKWTDVLWCFFTPVTVYKLKAHSVMGKGDDEATEDFAERVRTVLAEALNLEKTEFTAADLAEFHKRLKFKPAPRPRPRVSPPVNVSSASHVGGATGSCMESMDAELRQMIRQVKDVLPHVPANAVQKDLEKTKDVDMTISNILEGRVPYNSPAQTSSQSSSVNQDSTMFKASSFSRNPNDRHLSLADRKQMMYEAARFKYKQKHGLV